MEQHPNCPNQLLNDWRHIVVNRHPDDETIKNSFMTTKEIIKVIKIGLPYRITLENHQGLKLLNDRRRGGHRRDTCSMEKFKDCRHKKDLEAIGDPARSYVANAVWQFCHHGKDQSNILGNIGQLQLPETSHGFHIPEAETTQENLNFYGAILYKVGESIEFDLNEHEFEMPLTVTSVGTDYVKNYIYTDKAQGLYCEWHRLPHFHMPMNQQAAGHLILGKKSLRHCDEGGTGSRATDQGNYSFSAFRIPFGYAIYTLPYTIHADCYLTGDYIVAYSFTEEYSTVRFVDHAGKMVRVTVADELSVGK